MSLVSRTGCVFAHGQPTDMRKSEGTLAAIVPLERKHDILEGGLFVFIGQEARRAKVLYWGGAHNAVRASSDRGPARAAAARRRRPSRRRGWRA